MPAGRPRTPIDPEQVLKLAELGCKTKEIADFFNVTSNTIINNYYDELLKGRATVKISLRRAQLRNALEHNNAALQIWLGKQMLGQEDATRLKGDNVKDPTDMNVEELTDVLDNLEASKDVLTELLKEKQDGTADPNQTR